MAENSAIPAWKMPAYWGIDYQVDSLFSTLSSSSATSSGLYPITHIPRFDLTPLTTKSLHVGVIVRIFLVAGLLVSTGNLMTAQNITATDLKKELDAIRGEYETRINQLESRIHELETAPPTPPKVDQDQPRESKMIAPVNPKPRPSHPKNNEPSPQDQAAKDIGDTDPEPTASNKELEIEKIQTAQRKSADKTFEGNTEIRDLAQKMSEENLFSDRVEEVLQNYIDIAGYFRAGYGRSNKGGAQQAFGIPDLAKYRLGNEAENYGELAFAKTFFPAGLFGAKGGEMDGPTARMTYRLSFYNPYDNYGSAADTQFASPEVWGTVANVIPGMPDAKFWAGERFYRRHDINMNDFYFWDMSGGGGGLEDVTLGNGKFAFAYVGNGAESGITNGYDSPDPENLAGFSKSSFDFRYYDWAFLGGVGELGLVYSTASSGNDSDGNSADDADGLSLNLVKTDKEFLDKNSLNVASLQIGTGPAISFDSGFETFTTTAGSFIRPAPQEAWRFRATEQVVVQPIEQFSIGAVMLYQFTDYGIDIPDQQWVSAGLRPIWEISETFSIALESGVDWASSTQGGDSAEGGQGGTLGKLTLAPQISIGNEYFSRPVLRAFVTYAMWTQGLQGEIGGLDYNNSTSGWSWGLQMESWW
ncbi:MAG: carbohydrate porin [Akkermansiaceae bacterium]|nr:carbohydrate porin [Akkermansiaceae bacterium]